MMVALMTKAPTKGYILGKPIPSLELAQMAAAEHRIELLARATRTDSDSDEESV